MSLQSATSRDTVTISRLPSAPTQGLEGGVNRAGTTATAANRTSAGLKTSSACIIVPLNTEERTSFGIRHGYRAWKILFHADPTIDERDVVTFTDADSIARTGRVIEPSRPHRRGPSKLWRVVIEEDKLEP